MKPFDFARYDGAVAQRLRVNAKGLGHSYAAGLRPPPRITVSEWALRRKFPAESSNPGPWKHETAPYLVEPMDRLSIHDPAETVSIMKCAQSGGTASAENWLGYIADMAPAYVLYVGGTVKAAEDWAREKLWPMIRSTDCLNPHKRGAIMEQREKRDASDGEASTKLRVSFRSGGWLLLAGSNSAATLRQHSIRFAIEDDLDQFPADCEGQGDPEAMVSARQITFRRQGISKRLKISTPTNQGASKIGGAYERSDQRRAYLRCPGCASRFDPQFQDVRWPEGAPQEACLVAPCCGSVIASWQKIGLVGTDCWISTVLVDGVKPGRVLTEDEFQAFRIRETGLQPGYHITGIISAFLTFADLAVAFAEAQGDINKLRTFTNLMLGELFVIKGDAPPAEDLVRLIEQDWGRGRTPFGPLVFTLGCDVQGDGAYFELLGHGPNRETWSLDFGFVAGETDVPGEGAWAALEAVANRQITLPGGRAFPIDQICVDAGYHTEAARAFCKRHPRRLAVFGRDGWNRPVLGRGEARNFYRRGKRAGQPTGRPEDRAYIVGTYGAKLTFYGFLKSTLAAAQAAAAGKTVGEVQGLCRFGRDTTLEYLQQLTSEACVVEMKLGQPRRVWKVNTGQQNHWLDCRIYNHAAAAQLALDSLSDSDWSALSARRATPADDAQGDLIVLAQRRALAESQANAVREAPARPTSSAADGDWLKPVEGGWL